MTFAVVCDVGFSATPFDVQATVVLGSNVTLSASSVSATPVTYQWRKDGLELPGATEAVLVLAGIRPADAGDYVAVATNEHGATESNVATLLVVRSPFAGTYVGQLATGEDWALHVGDDGVGTFIASSAATGQILVGRRVKVDASGGFSFRGVQPAVANESALAARYFTGPVQGQIDAATGAVTGGIPDAQVGFAGERQPADDAARPAGYFHAVPVASGIGEMHAIAAPNGVLVLVAADAAGAVGARGEVDAEGSFRAAAGELAYSGRLGADAAIAGTVTAASGAPAAAFATAPDGAAGFAKVTLRGRISEGSPTVLVGFGVEGEGTREVLVRAAGPALAAQGFADAVANPRLEVFRGTTLLEENDAWGSAAAADQIRGLAEQFGAMAFPRFSEDAAVLVPLPRGSYTAQVAAAGQNGAVWVDVFEAANAGGGTARLVNVSTLGIVGVGGGMPAVGITVAGRGAKKLLIRGAGPALAAFGVVGALPAPRLQVFRGTQLLRDNTAWSAAPDPVLVAAAAAAVGAFPLAADSKDAALLLYLEPGSYSVQVGGVDGATGAALLEIYDVP